MSARWERYLDRWTSRGLIDPSAAERIRAFESEQEKSQGLRWPVLIAIAFGGLLLGAGVLLFVAAHWDTLAPAHWSRSAFPPFRLRFMPSARSVWARAFFSPGKSSIFKNTGRAV